MISHLFVGMKVAFLLLLLAMGTWNPVLAASRLLIPMDDAQAEHCRGYGLVYQCLEKNLPGVAWLLNYRGGSFLTPDTPEIRAAAAQRKITVEPLEKAEFEAILNLISEENMDVIPLEKAPRIGIYLSTSRAARSDIVARTLTYSGIPFTTLYDAEILDGGLAKIDWLHIHHKDFTGQNHRQPHTDSTDVGIATAKGFAKVWQMKRRVSQQIHEYVTGGGFLFAMCSAAETIDIALAAGQMDIVPSLYDGDPADPSANQKLDYAKTFAFGGFQVFLTAGSHYSDIDIPTADEQTEFRLFPFSATVDPVPTLLNQNHQTVIPGFSGETTSFRKSLVKKNVTILAENNDGVSVRYLCGFAGKGVFCFYGGHTPGTREDHFRKRAPGFRLILNNVLFPAAKTKRRKT